MARRISSVGIVTVSERRSMYPLSVMGPRCEYAKAQKIREDDTQDEEQDRIDRLQRGRRFRDRDRDDVGAADRDHHAELPVVYGVDRGDTEARREDAVERRRRTAALHVSECRHTSLVAGPALELACDEVPD